MPDSTGLLLFFAAALALIITPGPDMLYIIARSTGEGRRAGVASACGIGVGSLMHLAAVVLGLASLLEAVPLAYDVVRYAGASYLIYLGTRALLSRAQSVEQPDVERASLSSIFRQGVVTNALNPKVALFYAAFLPQFANPANGAVVPQLIVLGLLFTGAGTAFNLGVAYVAGRAGERVKRRLGAGGIWQKITGAIFVLLGVRLALQGRS